MWHGSTTEGEACFSGSAAFPISSGGFPAFPIFGPLNTPIHGATKSDQIRYVCIREEWRVSKGSSRTSAHTISYIYAHKRQPIFFRLDHAPAQTKIFVTRMLMRDLFAVANLRVNFFHCSAGTDWRDHSSSSAVHF